MFSITSLIWDIISLVLNLSKAIKEFLVNEIKVAPNGKSTCNDLMSKLVVSASKLPLYSFDDEHPFSKNNIKIICSDDKYRFNSKIHGALNDQWSKGKEDVRIVDQHIAYVGDGVSRKFEIVEHKELKLVHWDKSAHHINQTV